MQRLSRQFWLSALRMLLLMGLAALIGASAALVVARTTRSTLPTFVIVLPPADALASRGTPTATLPPPEATPIPATPTMVVFPADTVSLELLALQNDLATVNGYVLLLKASSRLQNARLALRDNDVPRVMSQLAVAQEDLSAATSLAPDAIKGNIQTLISDINYLRDDLLVRPETINSRLTDLWERTISLVGVTNP